MASGIVLQMDQAAPQVQVVLQHIGKCRQNQLWIAISVHVLVAIIRKRLGLEVSLHTMLQILSVTPFEKMPLQHLLGMSPPGHDDLLKNNFLTLQD